MNRFLAGNRVALLRSGGEFFPALVGAIDRAAREVWLETYIFADDDAGRIVAAALCRAARRGVTVRDVRVLDARERQALRLRGGTEKEPCNGKQSAHVRTAGHTGRNR